MKVIYKPKGRAGEYAEYAASLYRGCGHLCRYCYVPTVLKIAKDTWCDMVAEPRNGVLGAFRKGCEQMAGQKGVRVLFSFTGDPYNPMEERYRLTRQGIEILHEHGLGVELLTKGKNATRDFDILGENDRFARTLTFVSPELSLEWEPKAALPEERIDSLREAHVRGIRTWVSLEPVVDPAQTLELIRLTYPFVDLYKVGTLNYLPNETDWSGFLKDVTALLKSLNKDYIIKQDLAKYS